MSNEKKIKIEFWIMSDIAIIVDVIACIVIDDVSTCFMILLSVWMILVAKSFFICKEFNKKDDEINDK